MAFRSGKKLPKGLDDGVKVTKKQKHSEGESTAGAKSGSTKLQPEETGVPTIKPGERLSDFAVRVDNALPLGGLIKTGGRGVKDPLGLKVPQTKTEKKMHRIYAEWRERDHKIKERRQEALELAEEANGEGLGFILKADMEAATRRGKKKSNRGKRVFGEIDDKDSGDPWDAVKRARNEGPKRPSDVAQAPPQFTKVPKEKFKVRGARVDVEDVPKAAGSLRRREELGDIRRNIVERYRQMMKHSKLA